MDSLDYGMLYRSNLHSSKRSMVKLDGVMTQEARKATLRSKMSVTCQQYTTWHLLSYAQSSLHAKGHTFRVPTQQVYVQLIWVFQNRTLPPSTNARYSLLVTCSSEQAAVLSV